ncbi:hypothetical protein ACQP2T_15845 [Nonomuraea sp. CA-143628]|uniref:hypothetical protein n=1 Tax=Nonomuraea sp. CA-143628 TaxID=3239997 RepID=UPI003D93919C
MRKPTGVFLALITLCSCSGQGEPREYTVDTPVDQVSLSREGTVLTAEVMGVAGIPGGAPCTKVSRAEAVETPTTVTVRVDLTHCPGGSAGTPIVGAGWSHPVDIPLKSALGKRTVQNTKGHRLRVKRQK